MQRLQQEMQHMRRDLPSQQQKQELGFPTSGTVKGAKDHSQHAVHEELLNDGPIALRRRVDEPRNWISRLESHEQIREPR